MDSNECPQVTVIPAERGWELVIWQAKGDGEPDPYGGLRYLPVLAWRVEHHRHDDGDFDMTVPVGGPSRPALRRTPGRGRGRRQGQGAAPAVRAEAANEVKRRVVMQYKSKNCFTIARRPSGYCGCGCRARRGCPNSDSQAIRWLHHSINVSSRSFRVTGEQRRADLLEAKLTMVFTQQRGGENPARTAPSEPPRRTQASLC